MTRGRCAVCREENVPLVAVVIHGITRWYCPLCAQWEKPKR